MHESLSSHNDQQHSHDSGWTTPWTGALFVAYGDDLRDRLPEMFLRLRGRRISLVKWQYMELIQQMFLDEWAQSLHAWCREHRLLLTGHALHEDSLAAQAVPCGSLMRYYEHMDYPGVDVLALHYRNFWLVKQLASAARQQGKPWTLSELYGCTGWQTDFTDHKRIGDWQALFGINIRCHHLSWYTMAGEAKRDYPASSFFQSAWYKEYAAIEAYFARLSVLLQAGQAVCDVLVIHPVESTWAQVYAGWARWLGSNDPDVSRLEELYTEFFHWLTGAQIDFDYGDEDHLKRWAKVEAWPGGPVLIVGRCEYRVATAPGPDGSLEWTDDLPPLAERVFVLTRRNDDRLAVRRVFAANEAHPIPGPFAYKLDEPNLRVLDFAAWRFADGPWESETETLKIDETVRACVGLEPPGGMMVQPWARPAGEESRPLGRLRLRFAFDVAVVPMGPVELLVETPERFTIEVNGTRVTAATQGWFIDPCLQRVPIPAGALRVGENFVELEAEISADLNLETIYLTGGFGVTLTGRRATLGSSPEHLQIGELTTQGLPFYSGKISWRLPVPTGFRAAGARLILKPVGCAALKVRAAGGAECLLPWEPFEADLRLLGRNRRRVDVRDVPDTAQHVRSLAQGTARAVGLRAKQLPHPWQAFQRGIPAFPLRVHR